MFYYLTGTITLLDANLAVVDCGGVGYACHASNYTLAQLKLGQEQRLYTFCNIKEDAFDIYGFSSREELRLFEQLTGVTGVGPASALAIMTGDEKSITRAKGVGAKSAKRIILELKDKLGGTLDFSNGTPDGFQVPAAQSGKLATATTALVELGYSQSEASSALKGADPEKMTVEELVRFGLRAMVMK